MIRQTVSLAMCLAVTVLSMSPMLALADNPPQIVGVKVASSTNHAAIITWNTDKPADSIVSFGKQPHYGIMREPTADKLIHSITLDDLDASTIYHFRVASTDSLGNQAVSGDFVFTTGGFQDIQDINSVVSKDQQALVGQAKDIISKVTDPNALKLIQQQVSEQAQDLLRAPEVIGAPRAIDITSTGAKIIWATSRDSNSVVHYEREGRFDGATYSYSAAQLDDATKSHEVTLSGLAPASVYHFKVFSEDQFGLSGESGDTTFTTKSPVPTIEDVQIIKIEADSATFAWSTDIPAAGAVVYTNTITGEVRSEGSPEFLTEQTVRLTDLTLGATYLAVVKAENEQGEAMESEPITFKTVRDVSPPLISRVNNESTLYPGAETRIQTIVTWATDESSFCRLYYSQGLGGAKDATALAEETEPAVDHVRVVTEFLPATVYKFWVSCKDRSDNEARSEDFVLFTPEKEKSIIDIILENFQSTFGWIKNIGKKS